MKPSANIEGIYPLSPVQEGILFHTLYAPESALYIQQYTCVLTGDLETDVFQQAWQFVVDRHAALRSLLTWKGRSRPLQIIRSVVSGSWSRPCRVLIRAQYSDSPPPSS